MKNRSTEVDEEPSLEAGGAKVAEKLSNVFIDDGTHGLQLDDEAILDKKVSEKFAQHRAVFVQYRQGVLLHDVNAGSAQAIREGIFVDFLQMSVAVVAVNGETRFADDVT